MMYSTTASLKIPQYCLYNIIAFSAYVITKRSAINAYSYAKQAFFMVTTELIQIIVEMVYTWQNDSCNLTDSNGERAVLAAKW